MALSQPLRDDDVERSADGGNARVAKNTFRPGIPEPDDPFLVRSDDGMELVERTACASVSEKLMTGFHLSIRDKDEAWPSCR